MSCPYCSCSQCSTERQRWTQPWFPIAPPFVPYHPVPPPPVARGYWNCACGRQHPEGCQCMTFVSSAP